MQILNYLWLYHLSENLNCFIIYSCFHTVIIEFLITHIDVTYLLFFFFLIIGDLFKWLLNFSPPLECVLALMFAPLLPFRPYWSEGFCIRTLRGDWSDLWSWNECVLKLNLSVPVFIWTFLFNIPFKLNWINLWRNTNCSLYLSFFLFFKQMHESSLNL